MNQEYKHGTTELPITLAIVIYTQMPELSRIFLASTEIKDQHTSSTQLNFAQRNHKCKTNLINWSIVINEWSSKAYKRCLTNTHQPDRGNKLLTNIVIPQPKEKVEKTGSI